MKYISVRNFDKFQHYKKRNPPWIKFYASLLDDDDFERLPELVQLHLLKMWLLASRKQNAIPFDSTWIAKKIGAQSPVDLERMVSSGYCYICTTASKTLAHDASTTLADDATPETETETETETDSGIPADVMTLANEVCQWTGAGIAHCPSAYTNLATILQECGGDMTLARECLSRAKSKASIRGAIAYAVSVAAGKRAERQEKPQAPQPKYLTPEQVRNER